MNWAVTQWGSFQGVDSDQPPYLLTIARDSKAETEETGYVHQWTMNPWKETRTKRETVTVKCNPKCDVSDSDFDFLSFFKSWKYICMSFTNRTWYFSCWCTGSSDTLLFVYEKQICFLVKMSVGKMCNPHPHPRWKTRVGILWIAEKYIWQQNKCRKRTAVIEYRA